MNYKRNKKYFTGALAMTYLAIALLLLGIFSLPVSALLGNTTFSIICIVIGVVLLIVQKGSCPKDSDIDAELFNYLANQNLKSKALDKLGLDESEIMEIAPVYFDGYHFENVNEVKIGKDKKARSSQGRAVCFFFTKNEVYCYTYTVSLIENFTSEDTDTYFYSDIVSVATTTANGTINSIKTSVKPQSYQYDCFKLTTTGGTSMQAGLRDKAGAERSINGMRNLIKEKKKG